MDALILGAAGLCLAALVVLSRYAPPADPPPPTRAADRWCLHCRPPGDCDRCP